MIKLRRIGHATFETPDLDKQIEHFTQVTGLVVNHVLSELNRSSGPFRRPVVAAARNASC